MPKGWIPVADVYRSIALDFFEQLSASDAAQTPYAGIAGTPPERHDVNDVPFFLTWQVLLYCKRIALLEADGTARELNNLGLLVPYDNWSSANSYVHLPRGWLGSGVDKMGFQLSNEELANSGLGGRQPILLRSKDVTRGRSNALIVPATRGCPRKCPRAADVYRQRFPNGHEIEGLKCRQVEEQISQIVGESISWKTIRRRLDEVS